MSESNPNQPAHQGKSHATAAGAYGKHAQKHTPDQREVEARVLLNAANKFQKLQTDWSSITAESLEDALNHNRQIWMMFVDNATNDPSADRPRELRSNIANLGAFIFRHTMAVLAEPKKEKLNILIEINREIAAGLMTKPPVDSAAQSTEK